jgi:class 3 adenylate cyclase/tetratricopeptide (TPR) repeat protein
MGGRPPRVARLAGPAYARAMKPCPACGHENPDAAKFCMECAAPLGGADAAARAVRKTVTVVFSDVRGSTAMGERLDPESLRTVMTRYFDAMRAVLEHHGGTVEKFIGDAVMAVFGVPRVHEDDALRAVRAAADMREALAELNKDFERDRGVTIAVRTGVNTGEVVAGAGDQTIATGDAVNVAARLEQAAPAGEVLIGETRFRLVRDAVDVEPVQPLELKGKANRVPAYRLLRVTRGAVGHVRRMDAPMVGRDREAALLRQAFDRLVADRACQLFTVLGPPGVGKSRLIEEFAAAIGDATALRGRCLPYGDGITFFPVLEVVKEAAGLADFDAPDVIETKICSILEGEEHQELVCTRVAQLMRVSEVGSAEETFWAIRRLFEALARDRPLVLLFDDIHWGEPTFLDLIEHVADWSRDVPILMVCMARPELLDTRPSWGGGKLNVATISLEPLSEEECDTLITHLLGSAELPVGARDRIADAAEGNPLFVEEMLSVLVDDGRLVRIDGHWAPATDLSDLAVPPTIVALLTARLEQLSPAERSVLEAASVVGKQFFLGAVRELVPEGLRPDVPTHLMSLVRKEFVRSDRSRVLGEDAFRFRHLLLRDAAYDGISKALRAELHERAAAWLERVAGERIVEQEEVLGYHLERAHALLAQLGPPGDHGRSLAERASRHLAEAGHRALDRGDFSAASGLLVRAAELLREGRDRIGLLLGAVFAQGEMGAYQAVERTLDRAAADAGGDLTLVARVELEREILQAHTDASTGTRFIRAGGQAIPVLEAAGDDAGLARAWWAVSWSGGALGDFERGQEAARRSLKYARRAGDRRAVLMALSALGNVTWGPKPVAEELVLLEELRALAGDDRIAIADLDTSLASALAMSGDFTAARETWARAHAVAVDLGYVDMIAFGAQEGHFVETVAGDHAAAERIAREAYEILHRGSNQLWLIASDQLAQSLYELGRLEEAEELTQRNEHAGMDPDDVFNAYWMLTRGKILARRSEFAEGERLVRRGVERLDSTQYLSDRAFSRLDLAEVLRLAGRNDEAATALESAIELFNRKGNIVSARRAGELLAALRA